MILFLMWILVLSSAFTALYYLFIYEGMDEGEINYPSDWCKVSILVPAYNEEEVVYSSIENLLSLDYPDYEVVFVNDASTDSTMEKVKEFKGRENLNIINLESNKGKAGALNEGLEVVDGDYTVVQDADSVIEGGIIKDAVAKMESNENLGGVIARILPLNENSFVRKLQINEYTVTNFYRKLMCSIDVLDVTPGAFALYRTNDLMDIGGFDVDNLTEDLDVALRLRKKGRSLDMVYDRVSRTELPETFSDLKGQRVRWARGFLQNSWKHRDMFFNSKYGWFGRFQLPLHAFMPAVAIIGLALIGKGIIDGLYSFYITVSTVGFNISFPGLNLWKALLGFQWKIYVPLVLGLVLTGYMIKKAYEHSGKDVEHTSSLIFYFLGFFAVKAYFWSTAIFKEITKRSRVWT